MDEAVIFEALHKSAELGELLLVDGGYCRWHLRRDGQLTILEIIATRKGAGSEMLSRLRATPGAVCLFARCPADLPSNDWYARRGFLLAGRENTKSGRVLNSWRLDLLDLPKEDDSHERHRLRSLDNHWPELIYCGNGNPRLAKIATEAGFRYGAQLPGPVRHDAPLYFADQDWRAPDRSAYMTALASHYPAMATVLDWERDEQLPEILDWAEEASGFVGQSIVLIPKVIGQIDRLPRFVGPSSALRAVVLGYSVPTRYGATPCVPWEFSGRRVHLLGGSPHRQMREWELLTAAGATVVSADGNMSNLMATRSCKYWQNGRWIALTDNQGNRWGQDAPYEAFRRSCVNIRTAWNQRGGQGK